MTQHFFSKKIIQRDMVLSYLSSIDNLKNFWKLRESDSGFYFYTLGNATYLDSINESKYYFSNVKSNNKILLNNFNSLYQKIIKVLSEYIGEIYLEDELSLPGFHIFGPDKFKNDAKKMHIPPNINLSAKIHVDTVYETHKDFFINKYNDVDFLQTISVTLPLQLPKMGGGICIWDEKIKYKNENSFSKNILNSGIYDSLSIGTPKIFEYSLGEAFVFPGDTYHQIAPTFEVFDNDRRITLQAHAIFCDGAWRMFF